MAKQRELKGRYVSFLFLKISPEYYAIDSKKRVRGQPNVNGKEYASMRIPTPPLPEQHRIVAKVDELMDLCDTLRARLDDAQITQIQLADAIVEKAVM